MPTNPLVSVIVPVYMVEDCVETCIASLMLQTYQNLEIILVDDGSPDSSGRICDGYGLIDDRIVVIHKANGGVSDARNTGLDIARGEYIAFVDSDDWVRRDFVEYLVGLMHVSSGVDLAACRVHDSRRARQAEGSGVELLAASGAYERMFDAHREYGIYFWNKLFRAPLFDGIRFPVGEYFEESAIMHRVVARCGLVAFGPQAKYEYVRDREASTTNSYSRDKHLDKKRHLDLMDAFIRAGYPRAYPAFRSYAARSYSFMLTNLCKSFDGEEREFAADAEEYRGWLAPLYGSAMRSRYATIRDKGVMTLMRFADLGAVRRVYLACHGLRAQGRQAHARGAFMRERDFGRRK